MKDLAERFHEVGVVPVVVLEDAKDAVPLAQALVEGGLPCAEVTFRTAAAEESIRLMAEKFPEMLVGAGTVLTTEQVDAAVKAGAKFIVSPGFDPEIVDYCLKKEIPVLPGCISPSEVAQAVKRGLKTVKFFPAEQAGGVAMIKAMAAPYTGIKFMPTGGINAKNLEDYLSFDKIICCGGSWMVKGDLVAAGEFDKITELTKEAVMTMLGFELKHIGINCENEEEAEKLKKVMWDETGHRLPNTVAISPQKLALAAGFEIPEDRKFIAVTGGGINDIGKEHFFSSEKLTTLLALFKYEGEFENALTMMQALFNVGGKGHSCGIYSFSDDHIHRLGMAAPVSRIMVRQPNNRGNAGSAWNGMPPTSSMGCGTWGGNIVSENITLKHYMNTTWVARPIAKDMPSNEELFGDFFKPGMDEE